MQSTSATFSARQRLAGPTTSALSAQYSVPGAAQWRITRLLARGLQFSVYRAAAGGDLGPGCYVLKSINSAAFDDELAVAMLRREETVSSAVSHANLTSVLAAAFAAPHLVVLPFLEGVSLRRLVQARPGSLAVHYVLSILRQIAEALNALHSARWLHGQVRPAHVIVSPQGQATLIDLTKARRLETAECRFAADTLEAPQYAAPELFSQRAELTSASDIYSMGVMLFELLCGTTPFAAGNSGELARCHRSQHPPELRIIRHDASREVSELCRRMLAKDQLRRPDAQQVVRWLAELEIAELAI
jgi:eukaryotic-like serine/threonine-protein kinase